MPSTQTSSWGRPKGHIILLVLTAVMGSSSCWLKHDSWCGDLYRKSDRIYGRQTCGNPGREVPLNLGYKQPVFHATSWPRTQPPLMSLLHYFPSNLWVCLCSGYNLNHFPVSLSLTEWHGESIVKAKISPSVFGTVMGNQCVFPLHLILPLSRSRSS